MNKLSPFEDTVTVFAVKYNISNDDVFNFFHNIVLFAPHLRSSTLGTVLRLSLVATRDIIIAPSRNEFMDT